MTSIHGMHQLDVMRMMKDYPESPVKNPNDGGNGIDQFPLGPANGKKAGQWPAPVILNSAFGKAGPFGRGTAQPQHPWRFKVQF